MTALHFYYHLSDLEPGVHLYCPPSGFESEWRKVGYLSVREGDSIPVYRQIKDLEAAAAWAMFDSGDTASE